jgi:hypothetical protein
VDEPFVPPPPLKPDERTLGAPVHLLAIVSWLLGPPVICFVSFHPLQAVHFNLLGIPVVLVTCGIWVVAMVVVEALWCGKANSRSAWPADLPPPTG